MNFDDSLSLRSEGARLWMRKQETSSQWVEKYSRNNNYFDKLLLQSFRSCQMIMLKACIFTESHISSIIGSSKKNPERTEKKSWNIMPFSSNKFYSCIDLCSLTTITRWREAVGNKGGKSVLTEEADFFMKHAPNITLKIMEIQIPQHTSSFHMFVKKWRIHWIAKKSFDNLEFYEFSVFPQKIFQNLLVRVSGDKSLIRIKRIWSFTILVTSS